MVITIKRRGRLIPTSSFALTSKQINTINKNDTTKTIGKSILIL